MSNAVILLMGASGSGKTTVSKYMIEKYGWKDISSYTTRAPRFENEHGHIFISDEEFDQIPKESICAYTLYNGHRYCATSDQVDNADVYVIDPAGILFLKEHYHGIKTPVVVYLEVDRKERKERMLKRGDKKEKVNERLDLDDKEFSSALEMADVVINGNLKPYTIARRLYDISKEY